MAPASRARERSVPWFPRPRPSLGCAAERDRTRAPAAVGCGLRPHGAAQAAGGPALLAARPPRRRLQRHSALARGGHRVSSRASSVGPRRTLWRLGEARRLVSGCARQIAAALSICTYLLPDVLKRFQAVDPKVLITIRSGHSKEVLEMVLRGEAEIGLARSLRHPEVETLSLRDDPLILVARPAAWPGHARRARLEEVADRPLIFFDRGSGDWALTHGLFRRAGFVPNVALEVETIETAKKMVERGIGFAFLPLLAVGRELRRRTLAAIEITDAEPISRSLDVIHPRQRPLSVEARPRRGWWRSALSDTGRYRRAVGRELRRRTLAAIEITDAEPISRSLDVIHPRQRPLSVEARALLGVLRSALSDTGRVPRAVRFRRRARGSSLTRPRRRR